ncbi:uncharacterized protein TOT_020000813 [Theileria orientalis strain Shintoku]|uniref:Uncharacterized protein n=1 Tax=Theileria orientalis strain Shintoku TaxID=869250 RepID=J4C8C7_THEOR|nr:uncharacterized protein TOT_020000813 [Theileria orientalis strain Shintoku]BAM40558.1 uncharacterized protein TOT_020000813 [Theileria orientalis strain Shintoku]|eukprot:XP_009690859.1 uncharacterized protein TOT_020000813 [Theileria orientalis strain Shintoku]
MIPIKPLGRVLTQFIIIVGGSVIKATYNAYKQSLNNNIGGIINNNIGKLMTKEEAAKVLGFNSHNNLKLQQIEEAHKRLKNINTPSGSFQGSPYLIQRIDAANHILTKYYKTHNSNLYECVNYNVLLARLSRLKSINKNLISLNSHLNSSNKNTYVWNKYSLDNANRSLESIENTVNRLINLDNVSLLDSCKLLLNFKSNYNFIQLISANIDFYGNIINLYYLLKYVLNFNTLNNNSPCDSRDNNNLIRNILSRMCSNFSEMANKIATLELLCNFSIFHDDFAYLVYNYVTNLDNIDVLKANVPIILDYFNKHNTLINSSTNASTNTNTSINTRITSISEYDLTELLELYIDNSDLNTLKTDHLLTVFKYLLLTNLASKYTKHLKHIFLNLKLVKLSHILSFFDSLSLNSYPYLLYLSLLDNNTILSVLTRNADLINVKTLIAINSIYLLFFNSLKPHSATTTTTITTTTSTVHFVRFLNMSLTHLFNYYNSVVGNASLFQHYNSLNYPKSPKLRQCTGDSLPNHNTHTAHGLGTDHKDYNNDHNDYDSSDCSEHVSQDSLLKLTRHINKLLYDIADLRCLTYSNLNLVATFLTSCLATMYCLIFTELTLNSAKGTILNSTGTVGIAILWSISTTFSVTA